MKIHFTNLFGQSSQSVALMAQNDIMNVVRELGVNELGIYFYDHSNEPASELNSRMDGILAGVAFGDIVFVQSPSWNGIEWDRRLVDKLKLLQTKLVMFIHDVPPLMFESNYYLMPAYIEMYNKSDLVVVPSEQMYHRLVSEGLTVKKYVVQKLWDLTHSLDLYTPQFEKKLIFSGNPSRFPHIIDWKYDTPLHVYTEPVEGVDYSKVHPEDERDYYKENISYKLSTYLSAGLPVVVPDYLSNADYIREKGIGFVASSLEEANRLVQDCTEEEYAQMVQKAQHTSYLIRNGYFTKKLFVDSVMALGK